MRQFYFPFCFLLCLETSVTINPFKDASDVDYSASAFDVKKLVRHEQKLIKALIHYKHGLERKLGLITKYLKEVEAKYSSTDKGDQFENFICDFTKNPMKTYNIIHRFVILLPKIEFEIANNSSDEEFVLEISRLKKLLKFPNEKALEDVTYSLIRLKQTYDIPVAELAKGNLKGLDTDSGLTPQNCFEIGQRAIEQEVFSTAIEFFEFALENDPKSSIVGQDVINDVIKTHDEFLLSGRFERDENPFHYTNPLISFNHSNFKTKEMRVQQGRIQIQKILDMRTATNAFEKLCRGENLLSPLELSKLKCFAFSNPTTHPFYILNPIKIEFHSINPPVLQIYEVLTEGEMEKIRLQAQPELSRSRILTSDGNGRGNNTTYFRVSTTTWIWDVEPRNPFEFVNKRVESLTKLNLEKITSREVLQIGNYAPGGFYTPHYDAMFDAGVERQDLEGDRIATFMIYLSDVERGGRTVFPLLGVSAQPIKASALFWFNLHMDGSINRRTLHAGCPVLYGNKWVANKWIRSNDQMFTRKCPLQQTKDVFV